MPNNKDAKTGGSQGTMGSKPDREFEGQGKNPMPDKHGQQAGGSQQNTEDDEMTSGGREGQFADKSGGKQGQWSPGSTNPSDQ